MHYFDIRFLFGETQSFGESVMDGEARSRMMHVHRASVSCNLTLHLVLSVAHAKQREAK